MLAQNRAACTCVAALGLAACDAATPVGSTAVPASARPLEPVAAASVELERVTPASLAITSGTMRTAPANGSYVEHPSFRAELKGEGRRAAEIAFVYRGPSPETARLASGELRRQLGLKLRARDTCNVIYAMWHIEPSPKIEVSVKSNPDQRTHEECGDRGYSFVAPNWSSPDLPAIKVGERHTFRASIRGAALEVTTDGRPIWTGTLPHQAFAFDGPVGVRSDNVAFDFELWTEPAVQKGAIKP